MSHDPADETDEARSTTTHSERTTAENAQLALLLEVTATPKPGNVDRAHDYDDLRFEHFVTGAVGARRGLDRAAGGEAIGAAFERAVAGMSFQRGDNTQFGALLVLCPLVAASARGSLSARGASRVVDESTVADAAGFYRAFEHVDVAVDDPPAELRALDVRRGSAAIPAIEARELTLEDLMERSAPVDGIAREFVEGFERSFRMAERIRNGTEPVSDRAAEAFLEALATEPDTFITKQHDRETAVETTRRARATLDGEGDPATLADELVAEGINPGTTADLVAAGLFIALEEGLSV